MSKQMREMKDSGIEWIGEIPKEWDLIKCKYVTEVYTGNSIKDEEKGLYVDPANSIPYISTKDIDATFNSVAYDNGLFIKKIDTSFVRANKGDTLMCIEGGSAGRKKAILDRTVCFVNKLCCFHPTRINTVYLFYILNSPHYEEEFSVNISGLIGGVSKGKLMNFILPYPCYDTQHRIADYLDDKCGKIDRYIEQQKQVIEKLKAYKQSVITEAVTKGLDPTVPMKDSGVEWIGEIPEKYTNIKLKYIVSLIESGVSVNAGQNEARENELGVLKTSSVSDFIFNIHENKSVNKDEEYRVSCPVQSNTLIVSRMNTPELVGACGYVEKSYPNIFLPDRLWQVHFNCSVNVKYIWYYLRSKCVRFYISSLSTGTSSSMQNISQDQFNNIIIVLPTDEQQRRIVEFLDQKCFVIDSTIEKKQTLIDKLTEYKKSLIYEVVTGKKEV